MFNALPGPGIPGSGAWRVERNPWKDAAFPHPEEGALAGRWRVVLALGGPDAYPIGHGGYAYPPGPCPGIA
jgi:hypothetical protein